MLAMLKHRVSLAPDTNGLKSIGQRGEVSYLYSSQIFEAQAVKIVRNPVRFWTDLPGQIADVWSEALPLARDSFAGIDEGDAAGDSSPGRSAMVVKTWCAPALRSR